MYIEIENGEIKLISSIKTKDEMIYISNEDYDKLLKGFIYKDGEFIEREISNEEKLEKLKQELEAITNDLVNLNGRIKGAEDLKVAQIFDDDDELELAGYKGRLEELVIERAEIKAKIKEL